MSTLASFWWIYACIKSAAAVPAPAEDCWPDYRGRTDGFSELETCTQDLSQLYASLARCYRARQFDCAGVRTFSEHVFQQRFLSGSPLQAINWDASGRLLPCHWVFAFPLYPDLPPPPQALILFSNYFCGNFRLQVYDSGLTGAFAL